MHERLLLESYHIVDEVEEVDKASRRQVRLRGQVQEEVHHCVTHVGVVYQLKEILFLSGSALLIVLIFSLQIK